MQYFVVMIDYGRRGREAIVDPEDHPARSDLAHGLRRIQAISASFTRSPIASVDDITAEILAEAALPEVQHRRICKPTASITRRSAQARLELHGRAICASHDRH